MKIFIQGAGRGIGLAFAKHALASQLGNDWHLFLTARNPENSDGYNQLPPSANITWIAMDYLDPDSITKAGIIVAEHTGQLDRVISVAGVLRDTKVSPEKRIADLDCAAMLYAYQINAIGPVLLAKALWPLIKGEHPTIFASLSARVGSISDNRLGGWYAYRASKAAQNQLLRTMSIELARYNPHACVVTLHPGTVDTALSQPFQAHVPANKLFSAAYSADCLWRVMDGLDASDSGGFFAYDGSPIDY
ncbi:SDR family NAD(P)-dependent oxidoreductase [Alphaproteobacteria bacterium]|nr:SDR family NAD(P)-dependent oxidoreductase [Alphaproteobacteria bacterium]